jgi:uncharacterized membrane protein SpoIIM required for sporulation/ABC-type transport system involved in multi-copper enzyme maturation permease subunit
MALVITRREVRDQFRDWRIIFPIVVLTVIFPALMNFTARQAVHFVERYGASVIGDRLVPFLLMVVGFFPISVSLVIALESFVGEKERHSIEPLLSSPLTDGQMYLGKLLAAMVPPLFASYLGITVYLVGLRLQIGWSPDPAFLIQIVLLTTIQAIVMVSGAVIVSSQTTSTRAANLLASFIIIPMALLIQGESMVMFWAIYSVLWWIIIAQVIIACLLIRAGVAHFNREELLGRELDVLNFRWIWKIFKNAFIGDAHSVVEWFQKEISHTLRSMKFPAMFIILALMLAITAGAQEARIFIIPKDAFHFENFDSGFMRGLESISLLSTTGVLTILLHNLRVVLIATVLGIFSFGVLGVLILMIPLTILSYLIANAYAAGISVTSFTIGLVLPHAIFEIPAMILAGAAILNLGATLATPAHGQSIGEAWLTALARWVKVMIVAVIPLFILAAIMEVYITPQVALRIFHP